PSPYFGEGIAAGGGDDQVILTSCTFEQPSITLDDGDDTLALQNNTFGTLVADLGDGDDTAIVKHNTATDLISIDGGAGLDTLFALGNLAPDLFFLAFEVSVRA